MTEPFVALTFLVAATNLIGFYLTPPFSNLWIDAHIYFRATESWLSGGDPWAVSWEGIPFAAPPTALILNLPLIPFGEAAAVPFWIGANAVSVVFLIRRFGLPVYWVLFYPIAEGFLGATPDLTLAMLILVGAGAVSALTKPYAIPAMLAEGRWRGVTVAALVAVATIPLLPWGEYVAARSQIEQAFDQYTLVVSAFGDPVLMIVTALALVSLGRQRGLALTTPGLLAQQPHYVVFSLGTVRTSRILAISMTIPSPHAAALGIVAFAFVERIRARWVTSSDRVPRVLS